MGTEWQTPMAVVAEGKMRWSEYLPYPLHDEVRQDRRKTVYPKREGEYLELMRRQEECHRRLWQDKQDDFHALL